MRLRIRKKIDNTKTKSRNGTSIATSFLALVLMTSFAIKLSASIEEGGASELVEKVLENEIDFREDAKNATTLMEMLRSREIELDAREKELKEGEAKAQESISALKSQLRELEVAEENLRRMIGLADIAADEDVKKVTALYENMKPKNASAVFELMEPALAAGVLSGMPAETASKILANLTPEKSYAISVFIAGRNIE